jgi:hypothetical protein
LGAVSSPSVIVAVIVNRFSRCAPCFPLKRFRNSHNNARKKERPAHGQGRRQADSILRQPDQS